MARIISDNKRPEYINKVVKQKMDTAYSTYSRHIGGCIFVRYFHQNIVETTTDNGMGNTNEFIGSNSSIRYNMIDNLPLFKVDSAQFNLDYDELMGLNGSSESQGIIVPGTIEPIPNDYFTIEYSDKKYLYKVTSIETDDYTKKSKYYKISFKYDGYYDKKIEEQVVENFTCLFDTIGSEQTSIIKNNAYELAKKAEEKLNDIKLKYLNKFMLKETTTPIFKDKLGRLYYDPYLIEFISRNNIFIKDRSFSSVNINNTLELDENFDEAYYESIYNLLENKYLDEFNTKFNIFPIRNHYSYYGISGRPFYMVKLATRYDLDEFIGFYPFDYGTMDLDYVKSVKLYKHKPEKPLLLKETSSSIQAYLTLGVARDSIFGETNIVIPNDNIDAEIHLGKDKNILESECFIVKTVPIKPIKPRQDKLVSELHDIISLYIKNEDEYRILEKFYSLKNIIIREELDHFIYLPMFFFVIQKIIDNTVLK